MTLHDEFEQNVKTLVGILDDGINTTDKWFEDFKGVNERNRLYFLKRTSDDVISILQSFYPFRDLFPEILRFLTHHIPNFKDKIERGYSDINKKIQEIVGKCGYTPLEPPANPEIPYVEMCDLKGSIEKLAKDLRFCAQAAKEESAKDTGTDLANGDKKKKGIIGKTLKIITFIGILVGIFAGLHELGWLEPIIKAFYRILRHK